MHVGSATQTCTRVSACTSITSQRYKSYTGRHQSECIALHPGRVLFSIFFPWGLGDGGVGRQWPWWWWLKVFCLLLSPVSLGGMGAAKVFPNHSSAKRWPEHLRLGCPPSALTVSRPQFLTCCCHAQSSLEIEFLL